MQPLIPHPIRRIIRLFSYALPLSVLFTLLYFTRDQMDPASQPLVNILLIHLTWLDSLFAYMAWPAFPHKLLDIFLINWLVAALLTSFGSVIISGSFIPGD